MFRYLRTAALLRVYDELANHVPSYSIDMDRDSICRFLDAKLLTSPILVVATGYERM